MKIRALLFIAFTGLLFAGTCQAQSSSATPEPDGSVETASQTVGQSVDAAAEPQGPAAAERFADALTARISGLMGTWGETKVMGLEAWRYVVCFALLLVTLLLAALVRWFLTQYGSRVARWTHWKGDDLLVELANKPSGLFITVVGFWLAVRPLLVVFSDSFRSGFGRICLAIAVFAVIWYLYRIVDVLDAYLKKIAQRSTNNLDDTIVVVIRKTVRIFIVVIGTLFIGQSILKMNLAALLASAGVFGLAIAFAAQDTIANLFGSFMLVLDKPLKIGERVVIGGSDGIVESIGFRSTRIRTLDGHLVSVPNKETANIAIQNIGRRPYIKRVSNITITYDTPVDKVEKAIQIIRDLLDNHEGMDPELPPRAYFNEFNDCSLNILVIAWYHPAEYWDYLQWCEKFNLALMRAYEDEGIEFAFPTTTTYLAQDERRPLSIQTQTFIGGDGAPERVIKKDEAAT
jgi:MscS family membrane protein